MPPRTIARRARLAASLAALLAAVAAPCQRLPQRVVPAPGEFTTGQDDNLFSLGRSQENIHDWELGLAELQRGEVRVAVERLHRLLQTETGGVAPVGTGRFLGLRLAVVTTLANMPPAAVEAYETLVRREAGNLAEQPLDSLGQDQLGVLADRFPTSALGRSARLRLGDLALEAGDGLTATNHYRAALDAAPIASAEERRVIARLQAAGVLVQPTTARAAAAAKTLPADAGLVLDVLPPDTDPTAYPAVGGGADGRTPMAAPAGRPEPNWSEEIVAPGFDLRETGTFAMFPVGDLDGIYVNTGRKVVAFDPLRRAVAWESDTPMNEVDQDPWSSARGYEEQINHDTVLAAACGDDVVVAALQVPERSANVEYQGSFRIISKIPQRRLFAFSRTTGKLVWSHYDELDGQSTRRFRGHDACGPPLVLGDTVYAPIHDRSGAIAFSVAAYELRTGKLKWRRLVCSSQQDVNMFGNARMEFAASPLSVSEGVLYGSTNLGVVYAVEVATGRVRWITSYDVVRMPRTMLHGQMDRIVYFANNPPAIADRVVCATPLDSQFVLGLDVDTGQLLWRVAAEASVEGAENRVRWLAGVLDDEFVLAGRGVVAVRARPEPTQGLQANLRQLVRPEFLRERNDGLPTGRPAVTQDHVWLPGTGRISGFDRAGNPVASAQQIRAARYQPGNLLLVDGIVVSLRQRALDVLFDAAALQQRVEERLLAAPDDPAAILRLATLRAALLPPDATAPAMAAVQDLYRRGLAACVRRGLAPSHPVRQALQRELFDQAFGAADVALQRGDRKALELLATARDAAPDQRAWLRVQALVLTQCDDRPAQKRAELDLLEQTAPTAQIAFRDAAPVPVRAFVLWQRAQLPDQTPAAALALWQDLLENFGAVVFGGEAAATHAEAAIEALVAAHGPQLYAPIAARAEAALATAGEDPAALRDVGTRFPNAPAAAIARTRLLDRSVRNGDLSLACEVLAHGLRSGEVAPGIVRRVMVAAVARGNHGLARAMTTRLLPYGDQVSDWPDDHGATYRTIVAALLPELQGRSVPPPLQVPQREVARIVPRSTKESYRLLPVLHADGFARQPDAPLYAIAGGDLLAIDIHAPGAKKPVLFTLPVKFLEHVVACGTTLVVPDLENLVAVDYRTGQVRWEMPNQGRRLLDGLGVQQGILHLSAQPSDADAGADFLGIEPTTGVVMFSRTLPGDRMKPVPKPVDGQLLVMETAADGSAAVHRLDPVTGQTIGTVRIAAAVLKDQAELRPDGLATRMFPQGLCADATHVYLPIDSSLSGDAPRLVAVGAGGEVAWTWQGRRGTRLLMAAPRGDRLVVVEGSENRPGRVALLAAKDGSVLRETDLGIDVDVLNWQRTWLQNPAPAMVALSDAMPNGGRERRLVCFAVDDQRPSFVVPLANEDGEVERQPLFGDDTVTFGVRPAQRGAFRLYSLRLDDRSGALADGVKSQRLRLGPTFGLAAVGAYTVVSSAECLLVLGTDEENR